MSLRLKFALLVVGMIVVVGGVASVLSGYIVANVLGRELEEKGLVIARHTTSQLARLIIDDNSPAVTRDLQALLRDLPDARYGYVIGFDGEVVAHTFEGRFPVDLLTANVIPGSADWGVRKVLMAGEIVGDIGVRVIDGTAAEVHLGLGEAGIAGKTGRLRTIINLLSLAALTLSLLVSAAIVNHFTRPLDDLAEQAAAFGATGRYVELPVRSPDEIGELTVTFNMMAGRLTESRRTVEESEKRYRMLVELAREGIVVVDAGGIITFANDRMLEMAGFDRQAVLGRPVSDFILEDQLRIFREKMDRLKAGLPTRFETALRRPDGAVVVALIAGAPFPDSQGRHGGAFGMVTDITARTLAEEAVRRAKEDLERQNEELLKVDRIKDGLIRDVSHELKTPVAKLSMQMEILGDFLRERGLLEESREITRVIHESISRQRRVISNILDLARLEVGGRHYRKDPVQLEAVASEVLEDFAHLLSTHGFSLEDRLEPVTVNSDREMLWHVVSNLVSNAVKFRRAGVTPRLEVSTACEGGRAVLRVADNGIGMDEEEQSKAFERFYQASASAEGSGVGLTIVATIIHDLGGSIRLESPGRNGGTAAVIHLPLPG